MPTLSLNCTRAHVDVRSRNTLRYNVRVERNFRNEFFFLTDQPVVSETNYIILRVLRLRSSS